MWHYSVREYMPVLDSLPTFDSSLYDCKARTELIAAFENRAVKVVALKTKFSSTGENPENVSISFWLVKSGCCCLSML